MTRVKLSWVERDELRAMLEKDSAVYGDHLGINGLLLAALDDSALAETLEQTLDTVLNECDSDAATSVTKNSD